MSVPFHLVQVCNVGTITGGTGACAGTITLTLPDWKHTLLSFGRITEEMRERTRPHQLRQVSQVTRQLLKELAPDFVIFHNTRRDRVEENCLQIPTFYYQHSNGTRWNDIKSVACSRWLANQSRGMKRLEVLYQAVPRPVRSTDCGQRTFLSRELTIGRLCTPVDRKWPRELVSFYRELSVRQPEVRWEFVGCPGSLQSDLKEAVKGRAVFHAASGSARSLFWNWDVALYHHPTLTESFGRTAAEAMRTGCIPMVDDRGGFQEQIAEGTGYLCGSIEAFARAIRELSDPGERMRRSRSCRAHADDLFSIHVFRKRLLEVIRQVVV